MESHLVDGFFGRSMLILGLVLNLLPIANSLYFSGAFERRFSALLSFWGAILMFVGAWTSLFSVVLSASEVDSSGQVVWIPEFEHFQKWFSPVLRETQYGQTWQILISVLFLTSFLRFHEIRRDRFFPLSYQVTAGVLIVALFTRIGHGGAFELWSFWFWMQTVHLCAVSVWLSSLGSFALHVFSTGAKGRSLSLPRFSSVMNVVMPVLILTGFLRGLEVLPLREGFIDEPYLLVLMLKLVAVMVIALLALTLRRRIRRTSVRKEDLINIFSAEIATAGFVVFFSTLLSQLPPP